MTSRKEIQWLESEVTTIDRMLAEMPGLNPLSRMNLENRKAKALNKLAEARNAPPEPPETRITFRGAPVSPSAGIQAAFAGSALKAVSRIAGADDGTLSLAGTAWGPFGFRIVLWSDAPDTNRQLKHCIAVLNASTRSAGTLGEVVSEANATVVGNVVKLVQLLLHNNAICSIEHDDLKFSFADLAEVKASASLLERL